MYQLQLDKKHILYILFELVNPCEGWMWGLVRALVPTMEIDIVARKLEPALTVTFTFR